MKSATHFTPPPHSIDQSDTSRILVTMLGEFSISINGQTIRNTGRHFGKTWSLLAYLILYRKREMKPDELLEQFWPSSDSECANPAGALKTLLYRCRLLLRPILPPSAELIVQRQGAYVWTRDYETVLDCDQFEELCHQILEPDNSLTPEETLALCRQALTLYRTGFLPNAAWESWILPVHTYYLSLYQKLAHRTMELLGSLGKWEELEALCRQAIELEPFDETFHYHLVFALLQMGQKKQALEQYRKTMDDFLHNVAAVPSLQFRSLYALIEDHSEEEWRPLREIVKEMEQGAGEEGAFFCEYPVFRDLFQIVSRSINRSGQEWYMGLLSVSEGDGSVPAPLILKRSAERLTAAIQGSLRKGDVFCQYSMNQYLILLYSVNEAQGNKIMKRIIGNFKKNYTRRDLNVDWSISRVEPVERMIR